MKRRAAFPFLVLNDAQVTFTGWMIGDPGQPLRPAQDILEGWDYERDLEVSAGIKVDMEAAASALQVESKGLSLIAVLRAGTGAGTLPRRLDLVSTKKLSVSQSEVDLSGILTSSKLSGRLRLEIGLLFDAAEGTRHVLAPRATGSRLWSRSREILLEDGGDSRFPVELVSFTECFPGGPNQHAPWYLDWQPGAPNADFGGSVRLYVNSDLPEVADRFITGDPLTLQAMLADTMSQMVGGFVCIEDAEEILQDCADGSVGQQVRAWMDLAFPGQSIASVRAMSEMLPGRFRAALLSASDPGEAA